MRFCFFLALSCCLHQSLFALQPGGGGGVIIHTITDKDGRQVDAHDPFLQIRMFYFNEKGGLNIREYFPSQQALSFPKHTSIGKKGMYIHPWLLANKRQSMPHQMLQFIYHADTIFLELENIQMEDGTGISDELDSLQLIPGWYKISFDALYTHYDYLLKQKKKEETQEFYRIQSLFKRGITRTTLEPLGTLDLLQNLNDNLFTTVYLQKDHTLDTLRLPAKPLYLLPSDSIFLSGQKLDLRLHDQPMILHDTVLYRILLQYQTNRAAAFAPSPNTFLALVVNNKKYKIFTNGKPYSGYLKVFVPFSGFRPGNVNISGFNEYILLVEQGNIIKKEVIYDIDINETYQPVRLV